MSSIGILGTPPTEIPFADFPYFYYVGTKEKDGEDFVDFNKGMNYLRDAISLWYLFDKRKGDEISSFVKNTLFCELNDREIMFPDKEKYGYLIDVDLVKELYEMIDGIDVLVAENFTENDKNETIPKYYVLPEKESIVKNKGLGDVEIDSNRLSLSNEILSANDIKNFLKIAIDNNRELVIG